MERSEQEAYMRAALTIAAYARGRTSPNPLVGAVLVKDGRIVGQGWHRQAGAPHAEAHALKQAGALARGAALYVTLEPCSHYGRTPPCADAVIAAGVREVVVAMTDPNPKVAGRGLCKLRAAGLAVAEGVLAAEAARLNEVFIKWMATGLPFTILKTAMTLDGKIAAHSGESKWITGPAARRRVHEMRDVCDAVVVGVGTALADDPALTTRLEAGGRNPLRVIIDSRARLSPAARVLTDGLAPTWIAVTAQAPPAKIAALQERGATVLVLPEQDGRVNLRELWKTLGERNITSVLVEGGATINAALLRQGLADKVVFFIAPKIIGGAAAPGPVGGGGAALADACLLEELTCTAVGEDILCAAYVINREGRDVYRACGRIG